MKADKILIVIYDGSKEVYRGSQAYNRPLDFECHNFDEITEKMYSLFRHAGYMKLVNLCFKKKGKKK
ncbi:MAG: hypothetical protein WC208_14070 [Gallionella sp.]|jgi:hypothetical protein